MARRKVAPKQTTNEVMSKQAANTEAESISGVVMLSQGNTVLVATKDDIMAPAAFVDLETGEITSDIRPLGVWMKFTVNAKEPPKNFDVSQKTLDQLVERSESAQYRRIWKGL